MPYSQNDRTILMRWQVAKVRSDWRVLAAPANGAEASAEDKTIQREFYAAREGLQKLEDPELAALAKQAHPQVPDLQLNTADGYRRWCQTQQHIMEAELKLLAISRQIEDAFPDLTRKAHS